MTEEGYWASEMRDSDLDAAADAGEYFLEKDIAARRRQRVKGNGAGREVEASG